MPYSTLVEEIYTAPGEAIEIRYVSARKKLDVVILYHGLTLSQYPILYDDGHVAYDYPNRITDGTREECEHIMRTMRIAATNESWHYKSDTPRS